MNQELQHTEHDSERRERIELIDLGDATVETKQLSPWPIYFDSQLGVGDKDW